MAITSFQGTQHINDTDSSVQYTGQWVLNQFTDQNGHQQTYHSTAQNGSTIFAPFYGNQIKVMGITPTGQGSLTANYSIDGGQPSMASMPIITQSSPLFFQQVFLSPNTTLGNHNITITVLETGTDRNFSFQSLTVSQGDVSSITHHHSEDRNEHGTNVTAIVVGVLGTVIFLLFIALVLFYLSRRRLLAQVSIYKEEKIRKNTLESQRNTSGTLESALPLSEAHINPFILPQRDPVDTIIEQGGSRRSATTVGGTSLPPYSSFRIPSGDLSQAQNAHLTTRASYASSGEVISNRSVNENPFETDQKL
ncbi:uncharacterized protein FOMMEDRAFT_160839 [Fomitiporia mediterranea MF3/22]|uniref:uncharacterized protein n=1 Tax=Fomitiporia mediterranea (strain MF3/22) TaxID=694068 RepID=UPI00044073F0|nr:uncharacterized protein FOMMEDRAFT_160839 [Fomitiporia mediterranea MF3/22]EJC99242.1 hypothetical protein FOMMEDRAFT_160839 [Fomitiporia mediterranea MF3/22]